ncbi:LPS export ABC transporter permease LptF [Litorimonas cladophorae]|uniref:LPS export ABC transporter permease LptF n=1 Tax=Litorimonas cladophorae TaxID=1220491 RepID=A0A918KG64_9PROT|nr:LptF/LptG family permease [Litorimonas cladophorae]GGX61610.1 LPS export ABC transporter permease LptF [Litorimonas cladophorae]
MKLLQRYIFSQALSPAVLSLSALALLALLTQSLQTLDLIVENRQSATTFFYITVLALPQLIGIILPFAVFMAAIYALNRMTNDSELVVAKATGVSPWSMGTPIIRLGVYALILHMIINLVLQPLSFRQMRSQILMVKTDIASQMVQAGRFVTPAPDLTVYAREILPEGELRDVLIHDGRDPESKSTHTAKTGRLQRSTNSTSLILYNGSVQTPLSNGGLDVIDFETYQLDLSDVVALDNVLRLKSSDKFLHELLRPDPRDYITPKSRREMAAEGHARLAAPLWNLALVLIALAFILRGQHSKLGNGRKIAVCAVTGFTVRLIGFALASSAESDAALNPVQYLVPILVIIVCASYIITRKRIRFGRKRREKTYRNAQTLAESA